MRVLWQDFAQAAPNQYVDFEMLDRDTQRQLISDGLEGLRYCKSFQSHLLERPETPYLTMATEAISLAIETNPLQNHGRVGVCVPQLHLGQLHRPLGMSITLKDNSAAVFCLYSDMSCILALPTNDRRTLRATTLPFQLSSAGGRRQDGQWIKPSIPPKGEKCLMLWRNTDSVPLPMDHNIPEHADFMVDLALEIQAIFDRAETDSPVYQVHAATIPKSLTRNGKMPVSVYPGATRNLSPELLGWYGRTLYAHDAHLPYLQVSLKDIAFTRRLVSDAAEYIWREHGFKGKSFPGAIYLETAPHFGKESPQLRLLGHPEDTNRSQIRAEDTLSHEQVVSYIEALTELLQDVIRPTYYLGFHYLYRRDKAGSVVPFKLAEVNLVKDLTTDQPIKDLQSRLKARLRLAKRMMQ
jgi:hypothetical protein